jgi:hypothetical protein
MASAVVLAAPEDRNRVLDQGRRGIGEGLADSLLARLRLQGGEVGLRGDPTIRR